LQDTLDLFDAFSV
ncbi:hypothetical protein CISIN_1g0468571mg, partial [Citrus sinensis]